jgi:hypothetical protein
MVLERIFGNVLEQVRNPGPEDLALICPRRGLLNVSCKYNRSLEYWSDGVMEKPIYANLFSRKTPAKHESLRIFLAAARINTPMLQHSNTPGCLLWQSQLSLTTPKGRGFLCLTE